MFKNREEAGILFAQKLKQYKGTDTVVLAIPRGGAVTGSVIAHALGVPLDVVVVKKIGAPHNPELAIGAVGPKRVVYWDEDLCRKLGINIAQRFALRDQKEEERREREKLLRGNKPQLNLKNKTVILVDDGIATGATVLAAVKFLQKSKTKEVILAVPVVALGTLRIIEKHFDKTIALEVPSEFHAVGQFYEEFPQVSDNKVVEILRG